MKITLTVLFFAINCLVLGQDNNAQFSFEFAKTDLETAITTIEKQTNYTFFYDKQWINSNKITVNTSIKNQTIERVLNIIFEETDLNFYIDKKRIMSLDDVKAVFDNKDGGILIEGIYTNGVKAYYAFGL